jgi:hypothetical protein
MKRQTPNRSVTAHKATLSAAGASTTVWGKSQPKIDVQPAAWTKYVDSRLKQFCVR